MVAALTKCGTQLPWLPNGTQRSLWTQPSDCPRTLQKDFTGTSSAWHPCYILPSRDLDILGAFLKKLRINGNRSCWRGWRQIQKCFDDCTWIRAQLQRRSWKMPCTRSGPLRGTRADINWKKTTPRLKISSEGYGAELGVNSTSCKHRKLQENLCYI